MLNLLGRPYTPDDYAEALAEHLEMTIRIRRVPEILKGPGLAAIQYDELADVTTVWVADRLNWWLFRYAVFHELAHVAAGHPFAERCPEKGATIRLYHPTGKRLARKAPLTFQSSKEEIPESFSYDDFIRLYDAEAELRVQHNMLTAHLGERALEVERLNQF